MTKEELIEKLEKIYIDCKNHSYGADEYDHVMADELLLEYINDIRVTEAFDKIEKWYS